MSKEEPECCTIENTKVIDSRQGSDSSIRRRRECITCQKRFTTYESCLLYTSPRPRDS